VRRLALVLVVIATFVAAPPAGEAPQAAKVPRIGLLDYAAFWSPLLEKLTELGYVEGHTIILEYRASGGRPERLPALAQDLVQRRVDVIVTYGTPVTQAAKLAQQQSPS
jgi:putative tryptophan/tyrosine transport system substrate-binding protein